MSETTLPPLVIFNPTSDKVVKPLKADPASRFLTLQIGRGKVCEIIAGNLLQMVSRKGQTQLDILSLDGGLYSRTIPVKPIQVAAALKKGERHISVGTLPTRDRSQMILGVAQPTAHQPRKINHLGL